MSSRALTPKDLKEATDLSWSTVSDFINGNQKRVILDYRLKRIVTFLEIELNELLDCINDQ